MSKKLDSIAAAKAELEDALATPDYTPVYRTRMEYGKTLQDASVAARCS